MNGGLNLSVTKIEYRESSIWSSIDGLKSNACYAKEGFVCFVNFYRFIDRLKKGDCYLMWKREAESFKRIYLRNINETLKGTPRKHKFKTC